MRQTEPRHFATRGNVVRHSAARRVCVACGGKEVDEVYSILWHNGSATLDKRMEDDDHDHEFSTATVPKRSPSADSGHSHAETLAVVLLLGSVCWHCFPSLSLSF